MAGKVATEVKPLPADKDRSNTKPVSLAALSVQLRLMAEVPAAVATRFDGAAGGCAEEEVVVALATLLHAEIPTAFDACTR